MNVKDLFRRSAKKLAIVVLDRHPEAYARYIFKKRFHRKMNLDAPKDINEKINWLKFRTDTSEWSRLTDKYRVREYVTACGLADILVPLYGKWNRAEEINFDELPESFVLKTNNSSGTIFIVKNKDDINRETMCRSLNYWLRQKVGVLSAEPHYQMIEPCIVAEQLLPANNGSTSPIDYKIWCFNGEPFSIWATHNRDASGAIVGLYDLNWNYQPEYQVFCSHYREGTPPLPKPHNLDKMLDIARILAKPFPEVRVDLYALDDGRIYFGEMTFTSLGGFMNYYTPEYLLLMGEKCDISNC